MNLIWRGTSCARDLKSVLQSSCFLGLGPSTKTRVHKFSTCIIVVHTFQWSTEQFIWLLLWRFNSTSLHFTLSLYQCNLSKPLGKMAVIAFTLLLPISFHISLLLLLSWFLLNLKSIWNQLHLLFSNQFSIKRKTAHTLFSTNMPIV